MSTVPAERPQGPLSFTFATQAVRIHLDEQGEPWFCAPDVCDILGYANSRKALADHCKAKGVTKRDTLTSKGNQSLTFINEGNLFRLILKSRKPEAEKFEAVVCDEILPQIRKTGAYIAPAAMVPGLTNEQMRELSTKLHRLCHSWALGENSGNWVMNHLRVAFSVKQVQDIPTEQFPLVLRIVESKEEALMQYLTAVLEVRDWFERECLGAGTPWTPAIKAKLTKKLKRQVILPPKVDWLALAKEATSQ